MLDSAIGFAPPVKDDDVLEMPSVPKYWPVSADCWIDMCLVEFLVFGCIVSKLSSRSPPLLH